MAARIQTRGEAVLERLRQMVMAGLLRPGERLMEIPLAARLQVSRTPVRQALGLLAHEGLLDYTPQRGFTVRAHAPEEVAGARALRATLEAEACRAAASRLDGSLLQTLDRHAAEGRAVASRWTGTPLDHARWAEADDGFHDAVLAASGNPWHLRLVGQLRVLRPPLPGRAAVTAAAEGHYAILGALRAGDGEGAALLLAAHVEAEGRLPESAAAGDGSGRPRRRAAGRAGARPRRRAG
jgi:GntR family transcriptional regulator of vanillate catabolism